jgi:hypothetical protein
MAREYGTGVSEAVVTWLKGEFELAFDPTPELRKREFRLPKGLQTILRMDAETDAMGDLHGLLEEVNSLG